MSGLSGLVEKGKGEGEGGQAPEDSLMDLISGAAQTKK